MLPGKLRIEDFDYVLPDSRIAKYPLSERDRSRLLVYSKGRLSDMLFKDVEAQLGNDDVLVINDTRVIPARIIFSKATGGLIEIFCLEPVDKSHQDAMSMQGASTWKCLVGGAKKWKGEEVIRSEKRQEDMHIILYAKKKEQINENFLIEFSWTPTDLTFSQVLEAVGEIPLPPYFNRNAEDSDLERYQTVFSQYEGSVAAPTAGLHFTPALLARLQSAGIQQKRLTLHVGAGTFRPVSSGVLSGHNMHAEIFSVETDLLKFLISNTQRVIPVGTTSMRTLESLYWLGAKLLDGKFEDGEPLHLDQWEPYQLDAHYSTQESLHELLEYCERKSEVRLTASTSIMIAPGYSFRICKGLITNFHLPKSTLLVLVAALIGDDWKRVYDYAMDHGFRFLSYGDSSLLLP